MTDQPMRVLQVIGKMDFAGTENAVMNWYRHQDHSDIQFDFLVHADDPGAFDEEIRSLGGRIFRVPAFNGLNGVAYCKAVRSLLAEHPEWEVIHGHIGSTASRYLGEARNAGRVTIAHSHNTNGPVSPSELPFRFLSAPTRRVARDFLAAQTRPELIVLGSR